MKEINFKTKGYVAFELVEKQTKDGKVRQVANVLSPKIHKRKGDATKLKNKIKLQNTGNVIQQHLEVLKHALNIEQLRNDVLVAKENIRKGKSKAFNWIKGIWSNSVNYFRMQCAKIKLFRYINSLNKSTKTFVNDFLAYSQKFGCIEFNFNLNQLNIN